MIAPVTLRLHLTLILSHFACFPPFSNLWYRYKIRKLMSTQLGAKKGTKGALIDLFTLLYEHYWSLFNNLLEILEIT